MNFVNEQMEMIDTEWLALILKARELGLSIEEVRNFLNGNKEKELLSIKKASYKK